MPNHLYPDAKTDSLFSRSAGKVSAKQAAICETICAVAKRFNWSIEMTVLINDRTGGDFSDSKKIERAISDYRKGKLHWSDQSVEMLRAACDWFFCYR